MNTEERLKKAADTVADTAKQLITTAAGVLTFTVTFYEKLKPSTWHAHYSAWFLVAAWLIYLLSMWNGFRMLDSLTTALEDVGNVFTVFEPSIVRRAQLQRVLFLLATFLVLVFGGIAITKL